MMRPPMSGLIAMALEMEADHDRKFATMPEDFRLSPSKLREILFRDILAKLYDHIEHHILYEAWGQCRQCWGRWSWGDLYRIGETPGRPGEGTALFPRRRRPTPGDEVYCEQCLPRSEIPPEEPENSPTVGELGVSLYGPAGSSSGGYPKEEKPLAPEDQRS